MRLRTAAAVTVGLLAVLACGAPKPKPSPIGSPGPGVFAAGTPVFGISTVPRLKPAPTLADYVAAANQVRDAGAHASFESATWSDLETTAGATKLINAVNDDAQRGEVVLVTIKVIDTTVRATPADLGAAAFDAPAVIQRFHALIDRLRPTFAGHVRYLAIGNEVDAYLGAHPTTAEPYQRFYAGAVSYVHSVLPGVAVGVTSTFAGASGPGAGTVAALNRSSDVVVLTYYPLGPRFVPRPPSTATGDIASMVGLAGGKPVVLQEVGYPSDPVLSSSEDAQAQFVTAVIGAWRAAGPAIPMLNWFALGDFNPELCSTFTVYYGLPNDRNFGAYLCSLGLRRVDGAAKPAWDAFLAATA
jgi:hypothetical protein